MNEINYLKKPQEKILGLFSFSANLGRLKKYHPHLANLGAISRYEFLKIFYFGFFN